MKRNEKDRKNKKSTGVLALVLILLIILLTIIIVYKQMSPKNDENTLAYTDLIKQVTAKNINKVEMTTGSTTVRVTLKKEISKDGKLVERQTGYRNKEQIVEMLEKYV